MSPHNLISENKSQKLNKINHNKIKQNKIVNTSCSTSPCSVFVSVLNICVGCVLSLILQQFIFIYLLIFSFISKILKIINVIKSGIFRFQFCIFNSCHCAKIVGKIYYCYCFNFQLCIFYSCHCGAFGIINVMLCVSN